ncbi:MAG: glycosyltransferase [Anaerolineales bacterium]|nr:glycosyltransferase [Anaerolineales bacterium]
MRIGMMVDMYKPNISGITSYVSLNKQILESLGHKVFVFTFGDLDYEDTELYVIRSPGMPLNINATGFHISFRYTRPAQRKLRSMDVVHVHHPFLSGPLALRYAKSRGLPVVYTNHTRFDLYAHHYLPSFVPEAVGQAFLKAYLPGFCERCDVVIAPSNGIARVLRDMGVKGNIKVIPNGIDLAPYQAAQAGLTRAQAGLADEAIVLMYVGRLSPEKNLAFLLRAFFGVASACPGVALALVGDGPELENLHDQAQRAGLGSWVHFLGKVEHDAIPAYLRLADVFVTASVTEVHPFSLIEAMAAGLPAVGIDSPGVGDTVVDGENGYLSSSDLAAYTAKLMRIVLEPETRRRMAERARESAQQYDIQRTARLVLAEYEQLAGRQIHGQPGRSGVGRRLRQILP